MFLVVVVVVIVGERVKNVDIIVVDAIIVADAIIVVEGHPINIVSHHIDTKGGTEHPIEWDIATVLGVDRHYQVKH
jgi:hypothetical protein